MTEVADKPAQERRALFLDPQRRTLREQARQDWVVTAEPGTTVDDVLQPQYWAHVAKDMVLYDRVEVLIETGEWMAELLCTGIGRNWARMHLLARHELTQPIDSLEAAERYTIDWKGPQRKFAVIRKADAQIVQDGFTDRNAANVWLANHERVTG